MGTQGEYNTNKNPDPEVAYTVENIEKCRCSECPVQIGSRCVIDKMRKSKQEIKRSGKVPMPENVPGIYCSADTATCTDIDTSQPCICGNCAVYQGYNLAEGKPADHFCKNGRAF
ncbi:MAG: DUF2769 domain-containing protein [Candidatus Methanoperedens sp.]|nr:DUF2769 domain-containing protein [Candidatus Methanoperedens sp.]